MLAPMPRLWNDTIEEHRRAVRETVLDTAAALVHDHGLLSVTMSQIAEQSGIGRATLYKYFPDVEAVLTAWHERQLTAHVAHLVEIRDRASDRTRIPAVLEAFADLSQQSRRHHRSELVAVLHSGQPTTRAMEEVRQMLRDLLERGVSTRQVRDDIGPDELATYCLHALSAGADLPTRAAVRRLVSVTLAGIRPQA